jgi:hypothetical protein
MLCTQKKKKVTPGAHTEQTRDSRSKPARRTGDPEDVRAKIQDGSASSSQKKMGLAKRLLAETEVRKEKFWRAGLKQGAKGFEWDPMPGDKTEQENKEFDTASNR